MDDKVKSRALRRLSIAEGHLKKVSKMVANEAYCPDVIHQSQAVQAALKKVDEIILQGHLHTCVLGHMHDEKPNKEELVEEIVDLFRKTKND